MEEKLIITGDNIQISDGYHTFEELYDHRIELYIALCRTLSYYEHMNNTWRSKLHSDGTSMPGLFVLGINTLIGRQITYHLPISRWDNCDFAEELEKAPEFDGHTSKDVLARLKES